jgi:transposase-like protein
MPKTTRTRYSLEDRERGLAALVIAGSSEEASEVVGIPAPTLRDWKTKDRERYEALRHTLEREVGQKIAADAEHIAQLLTDREIAVIQSLTDEEIAQLKPADKASTIRNLSTSKALQMDKIAGPMRERPAYMPHTNGVDDLVTKLSRALGFDATSTATDSPTNPPPKRSRQRASIQTCARWAKHRARRVLVLLTC